MQPFPRRYWLLIGLIVPFLLPIAWSLPSHFEALRVPLAVTPAFVLTSLFLRESAFREAKHQYERHQLGTLAVRAPGRLPLWCDAYIFGRMLRDLSVLMIAPIGLTLWSHRSWGVGTDAPMVIVFTLGLLCTLAYSSQLHWYRTGAEYPYGDFPLTQAFVFGTTYALVLWCLTTYLLATVSATVPNAPERHFLWSSARFVVAYGVTLMLSWALLYALLRYLDPPTRRPTILVALFYLGPLPVFLGVAASQANAFLSRSLPDQVLKSGHSWWVVVLGVAWFLTVLPAVGLIPNLALALNEPARRGRLPHPGWFTAWRQTNARQYLEQAQVDLVRGHLLTLTILRQHAPFFVLSLPFSMLVAVQPLNVLLGLRLVPWGDPQPFTLVNTWIASTLAWGAPFVTALYFLEDTFARAYAAGLYRTIQRLRDHVLVLGYGDLGRRLVREQFEKQLLPYTSLFEQISLSRNILMPSGRLAKVFVQIAAVDSEENRAGISVRTPDGVQISVADLTQAIHDIARMRGRPRRLENSPVDYVIPVVIGDATSDDIQHLSQMQRAAFVACLLRDADGHSASQSILHSLEKASRNSIRIPAALAIHSSTYVPYVTSTVVWQQLPVHTIFLEHLQGLNAGAVVHAAYVKFKEYTNRAPRVLICGRGRRVGYLLDSFIANLTKETYEEFAIAHEQSPMLAVMGHDAGLAALGTECLQEHFPGWDAWGLLNYAGLTVKRMTSSRFVLRHPMAIHRETGDSVPALSRMTLHVPLIYHEAQDYEVFRAVWEALQPDVIVVSAHRPDEELRALQSIINSVSREPAGGRAPLGIRSGWLPTLFVSGETGKRHMARKFEDALVYYSSLWDSVEMPVADAFRHFVMPTPEMRRDRDAGRWQGDPLIDVLQDPIERVNGLIRAYDRERLLGANAIAVELHFCDANLAGTLAVNFARLAGYAVGTDLDPLPARPSFVNARIVHKGLGQTLFRSFAYLTDACVPADRGGFSRVAVVCGKKSVGQPRVVQRLQELLLDEATLTEPARNYRDLVERDDPSAFATDFDRVRCQFVNQAAQCCGMSTCPVEGFQKVVLASVRTTPTDEIRSGGQAMDRANTILAHFMVDKVSEQDDSLKMPNRTRSAPYAELRVHCLGAGNPGTIACAVNALLFRTMKPDHARQAGSRFGDALFNFTYVSSYECHDERFGVITCYGTLEKSEIRELQLPNVLGRIEIRRIRGSDEWLRYAERLVKFLREHGAHFRLVVSSEEDCVTLDREPSSPSPPPTSTS